MAFERLRDAIIHNLPKIGKKLVRELRFLSQDFDMAEKNKYIRKLKELLKKYNPDKELDTVIRDAILDRLSF